MAEEECCPGHIHRLSEIPPGMSGEYTDSFSLKQERFFRSRLQFNIRMLEPFK